VVWGIYLTDEVDAWLDRLLSGDPDTHRQVVVAIEALAEGGPNLGRPLVDRIKASSIHNLKELRPGSKGQSGTRPVRVRPLAQRHPAGCRGQGR
jgi:hypothetical protein